MESDNVYVVCSWFPEQATRWPGWESNWWVKDQFKKELDTTTDGAS